jgi:hypothetical protein
MNKSGLQTIIFVQTKAKASETEHKGKTTHVDFKYRVHNKQITNWFACQVNQVISQQRGAKTKGGRRTSPKKCLFFAESSKKCFPIALHPSVTTLGFQRTYTFYADL